MLVLALVRQTRFLLYERPLCSANPPSGKTACQVCESKLMIGLFKWFGRAANVSYQPHPDAHRLMQRPAEAFEIRRQFVSDALHTHGAQNYCDLGCAEGFYVRRVAIEHRVFA